MWGNFKSYIGQYYTPEETANQEKQSEEIEDWVLVDIDGNEIDKSTAKELTSFDPSKTSNKLCLSPLPLLDISNTSSPQSSPQLSPTKIEDGWFVAPPPCFTKTSLGVTEISPLEDLLIEHPSISVYAKIPGLQWRDKKTEDRAVKAVVTPIKDATDKAAKRTKEFEVRQNLLTTCTKARGSSLKTQLDLKSLIEQAENTKPAQPVKWDGDQFKLCPSYMSRQNRVYRYQSRKHHNQKKKSIAKPFAEKGKHSF